MLRNIAAAALVAMASNGCANSPAAAPTSTSSALTAQSFVAGEGGFHVTSTIVLGEREAVLIDSQLLQSEATRLVDTIRATGRHLHAVYVTHAHPDHSFGLSVVRAAFPDAEILAHPTVVAELKAKFLAAHDLWKPVFKDDLTDVEVDPAPYDKPTLEIEGHSLQLIGPVQGDTSHTVSVFLPDSRTLVAGDVSFGGVHVWLADSKPAQWDAWLATLQRLRGLDPAIVVSGHRDPRLSDDPASLDATARYVQNFKSVVASARTADDVVKAMTSKYPSLKLPVILQKSAKAAFPDAGPSKSPANSR